jgi:hypothetical protein
MGNDGSYGVGTGRRTVRHDQQPDGLLRHGVAFLAGASCERMGMALTPCFRICLDKPGSRGKAISQNPGFVFNAPWHRRTDAMAH